MASLKASSLLFMQTSTTSTSDGSQKPTRIRAATHVPNVSSISITAPSRSVDNKSFVEDHKMTILESFNQMTKPLSPSSSRPVVENSADLVMAEVYMILEAVSDRVEMHKNVGEQRNNWNTLLLSSINMMTLTATAMSGLAATSGATHIGVNMSSFVMFTAATGMLVIMNKIQPSQLAEEQRNATRLFKRLEQEIKTLITMGKPTRVDVMNLMGKVLALDRAYPLPLIGAMIEKFPAEFKPTQWWPTEDINLISIETKDNGWSETLERQMGDIVRLVKAKDSEEYARLGNIALKLNKVLAVSGPALTGIAALASAFASNQSNIGSAAAVVAMVGGALACAVSSFEHGGQVGMVAEMYRNCAGAFKQMEESIESNMVHKRENGEVFEMRVALQLGRSLSELREVARKSSSSDRDGTTIDGFASKLI